MEPTTSLLCPNCGAIYEPHSRSHCQDCGKSLIEIDNGMICIIQALHAKGYSTIACCEGHHRSGDELEPYIGCDVIGADELPEYIVEVPYILFPSVMAFKIRKSVRCDMSYFKWCGDGLYFRTESFFALCDTKESFEELKKEFLHQLLMMVYKLPINKVVRRKYTFNN